MDPQQNSNPEVNPGATEGHTAAADREPNQEMEDLLNEEDLRAQEARRQAEGELWEKEPQRRTRSNVESVPDGRMGRAMQGAGKVLGGAVEFIFRMIRELLQGLFGKIMNKDLKGERENLEQEVEVQKRHLNDLTGEERSVGRELTREKEDLQEARERKRTEDLSNSLKGVAAEIMQGQSHDKDKTPIPPPAVGSSPSKQTKEPAAPASLGVHEDSWISQVKAYAEGISQTPPYDDRYLRGLMGGDVRHAVTREALEEVRRITQGFDSARSSENNYDVDARFPQMLAAVAYAEAVCESMEAAIANNDLKVPSRVELQERIELIVPRVIHQMRERGDHADKWADTLMARADYNSGRIDDMRAALNRAGVRPPNMNTHEIESDANRPAGPSARLPGPGMGPA